MTSSSPSSPFSITDVSGDLFAAPPDSILVHACNTKGSWGAGIALAFRSRFPQQFELYRRHCLEMKDGLVGTCLMLGGEDHWIACLFTSRGYGRNKDGPEQILAATKTALEDLVRQNTEGRELHACRFNSGKFGVPWDRTARIVGELGVEMTVYTGPSS